jgi:hypothetical protein
MQCRNCGTEIADKAIVCFRCGAATTDPVRRPAKITPRRRPLVYTVLTVVLAVLALYLVQLSRTAADAEIYQLAAGICAGGALAVLLVRILRR